MLDFDDHDGVAASLHTWIDRWEQWRSDPPPAARVGAGLIVVIALALIGWRLVARPAPVDVADTLPVIGLDVTTSTAPPVGVVVHVVGAVRTPGVVTLPAGARVADALEAAGGTATGADPARLNLAAPLVDGTRIHVPRLGDEAPDDPARPEPTVGPAAGTPGDGAGTGVVDVNTAGAAELESLPGVGPATAAKILASRDVDGPFGSVDDLLRVSGIGPATLDGFRDRVRAG